MNVLLLPAVCHSDDRLLEHLIEHGANIHGTYGPDDDTLLHIAIRKLWSSRSCDLYLFAVIRVLLMGGSRVDALNSRGLSALHLLCLHLSNAPQSGYAYRTKVLDMLLKAGANVNLPQPETGATPLHCALLYGPRSYLDCVTKLLSAGANPLSKMYVSDSDSVFVFCRPVFERLPHPLLPHSAWKAERQEIMRLLDAGEIPVTDMRRAEFWEADALTKYLPPVVDKYDLNDFKDVTSYLPREGVITALDMAKSDDVADDGNTLYCALKKEASWLNSRRCTWITACLGLGFLKEQEEVSHT